MEHIKITGLPFDASRIGLGTWAIGGWLWGGTEESDAINTIHAALDNGINLIDTAPVYGFGRSEELVGKALQGGRRAGAIIATKVGLDWGSGKILRNSTPARLRQELEDLLRRLKTDVIDIYQVHWPDASVPFEETARTLEALRREGKIRAIGVSNFSPEQMDRFRKGAPLAAIQPPYNLFEREIEKDVLPYAERERPGGARLWRALPRAAHRQDHREDGIQRRRLAQDRPEIPATAASASISRPSSGSTASPASATARRCLRLPSAGCSTAARSWHCGAPAGRISSPRSPT